MSACDCDTRDPIEGEDYTLYRCPHCPDCGVVGSYQGAGSTSISNWRGRPYSRYYCPDCGTRYKVYAVKRDIPRI